MAVLRIAFLSSTVLELFSALGIALAAVYVGFSLLGTFSFGTYGAPLSVAGGIFILLMVPDFFQPLRELAAAWHDRAAALAVAGEIAELEDRAASRILGRGGEAEALAGAPTIAVRDLAFDAAGRAVRFPDFTLRPGEKLAITGESGAGKTTLLGLIAGLVRPERRHHRGRRRPARRCARRWLAAAHRLCRPASAHAERQPARQHRPQRRPCRSRRGWRLR